MQAETKFVMESYGQEGAHTLWDYYQRESLPQNGIKYAEVLTNADVLPKHEKINGFVLFSPSANQRTLEFYFAHVLEQTAQEAKAKGIEIKTKPEVIMSDVFGQNVGVIVHDGDTTRYQQAFVPGFHKDNVPQLPDVKLLTVSAEAHHTPLPDHSVDVVWDRLGALWHACHTPKETPEGYVLNAVELVKEYGRILKSDGCLVIDAADKITGADYSTFYASGLFRIKVENGKIEPLGIPSVDWEKLGWSVEFAGEGENKVAIIRPKR